MNTKKIELVLEDKWRVLYKYFRLNYMFLWLNIIIILLFILYNLRLEKIYFDILLSVCIWLVLYSMIVFFLFYPSKWFFVKNIIYIYDKSERKSFYIDIIKQIAIWLIVSIIVWVILLVIWILLK